MDAELYAANIDLLAATTHAVRKLGPATPLRCGLVFSAAEWSSSVLKPFVRLPEKLAQSATVVHDAHITTHARSTRSLCSAGGNARYMCGIDSYRTVKGATMPVRFIKKNVLSWKLQWCQRYRKLGKNKGDIKEIIRARGDSRTFR